jgi:hypothetical protein
MVAQVPDMRSIQRSQAGSADSTKVHSAYSTEVTSTGSSAVTSTAPAGLCASCYEASGECPSEKNNHHSFQHCRDSLV